MTDPAGAACEEAMGEELFGLEQGEEQVSQPKSKILEEKDPPSAGPRACPRSTVQHSLSHR